MHISVKNLSDKQREAWRMRYRYGWRLERIALELGSSKSAVSRLLERAQLRAGLPRVRYISITRLRPTKTRVKSLSTSFDY